MAFLSVILLIAFLSNCGYCYSTCDCSICGFGANYSEIDGRCLQDHSTFRLQQTAPPKWHQNCCDACGFTPTEFSLQPATGYCKRKQHVLGDGEQFLGASSFSEQLFARIKCAACTRLISAAAKIRYSGGMALRDEVAELCDATIVFTYDCRRLLDSSLEKIQAEIDRHISEEKICSTLLHVCSSSSTLMAHEGLLGSGPTTPAPAQAEEFFLGVEGRNETFVGISR